MKIMIVGGDAHLLSGIARQIGESLENVQTTKLVALNHAIEYALSTPLDLVISTLPLPAEQGLHLSDVYRSADINKHVPVISYCTSKDNLALNLSSEKGINYFATNLEEIAHLVIAYFGGAEPREAA